MPFASRPLAVVTGASSGIGLHLARLAAEYGFDLAVAADEPLGATLDTLRALGADAQGVEVDLATREGVDALLALTGARPVDALFANAGHGLGRGFLDQDFAQAQHVIDTNITGTLYMLQRVARRMRARGHGRILVTGSIAGFQPGSYQAVYNGSKAFIDSFAMALRNELQGTGVSLTCLQPGVTNTRFFARAGMLDTAIGRQPDKADPAEVARIGFHAMMKGEAEVVAGWRNRLQVAMAHLTPNETLAEQHRKLAQPDEAQQHA